MMSGESVAIQLVDLSNKKNHATTTTSPAIAALDAKKLNEAIQKARSAYMWKLSPPKAKNEYRDMPHFEAFKFIFSYGIHDKHESKSKILNKRLPTCPMITNENAHGLLRTILQGEGANNNRQCFKYCLVSVILNKIAQSDTEAADMVKSILADLEKYPAIPITAPPVLQAAPSPSSR